MKARIMTDELGVLSCQTSSHQTTELIFNADSILDWYPLDINYEYRFNPKLNKLYLVMAEKDLPNPSYGVDTLQGRVTSNIGSFNIDEHWYCPEVREDNMNVMLAGFDLGLVMMDTPFDREDLADNRRVLAELENDLRQTLDDRLRAKMVTTEQRKAYVQMDWETKDIALFKMATKEELDNYLLYGKLHVLCELMRRVLA